MKEKLTLNNELEVKPEDFDLSLHVQHWSGCWGGTVPKILISNTHDFLEELYSDSSWLSNFLNKTDSDRIVIEAVSQSENGRRKNLSGQDYIIKVQFKDYENNYSGEDNTLIIVTCADGNPAYSQHKYDSLQIGRGLFQGYILKPGRFRYTLTYSCVHTPDGYDHLYFKKGNGRTIIGSHIFSIENKSMKEDIDLSFLPPVRTSIIVHNQNF